MDLVTISRYILPIIAVIVFSMIAIITKAPRPVLKKYLAISWVAGVIGAISYILGREFGFWHYTLNNMLWGLPFERFLAASIAYGGGFGLIFWKLKKEHQKYLSIFIVLVPFYGLLTDFIGTMLTGTRYWSVDSSYWPIADLLAWTFGWLIMVIIYNLVKLD